MQTVNIHAAKTHLSRLLDAVAGGEEILIARAGRPIARLVPLQGQAVPPRRRLGLLAGQITVPEDFDAPLSEDILGSFEGR
ncbi:type II toxin-antitoxin system Phd/YefM family antitoxin [Acidocella aromatica]|uniref:Antitoxin n=1 Tax=Acidocella aromatica TaxID=1303579 RepID=A0A840V9T5_9PROT|nr:type II toxin-antitoxin system Phd/YefM family antitoxin [Acidocella aromatica]MBB5372708.1 prevent-host-death family protein [Acidocella aromatica]